MYTASILEMRKKLKQYAEKPDSNAAYVERNKSYLDAIESYVIELENQIRDAQFNKNVLVLTTEGVSDGRLLAAERKLKQYEAILEMKGIKQCDIPYMLEQSREIDRHNNIMRAKQLWAELY